MRTKLGGELGRLWVYQNIEVGHKFEPVVEKSHEDAHLEAFTKDTR